MTFDWLYAIIVPPSFGWAWSVEKRLSRIDALKDKLDSVDNKTERLVDHLIGKADVKTEHQDRG